MYSRCVFLASNEDVQLVFVRASGSGADAAPVCSQRSITFFITVEMPYM